MDMKSSGVPEVRRSNSYRSIFKMQATGSLDALVAFNGLRDAGTRSQDYIKEVARVLKPGAPFIFFDRGAPNRDRRVLQGWPLGLRLP